MSLVKLAAISNPIVLAVPQPDLNATSSRALNTRNIAAVAAGTTAGFGASELLERKIIPKLSKLKSFNKNSLLHKYVSKAGGAAAGLLGAATAYKMIRPKQQDTTPRLYML